MKNKWKFNPLLRMFVFLSALILLVIITGIGLFYYVFSIPEPEGLSLADWPNRFTGNFSLWMENDNGTLRIEEIGLERLDEYDLWLQVIDESGQEVFSHNKPEDYPTSYSASELVALGTNPYENGNTIFVNSFEDSGQIWTYVIGFPYAVGKHMLSYNGETVSRLSPVFRITIFSILFVAVVLFIVYSFWLMRQMGKITRGIRDISLRTYKPLSEEGIFNSVYA